MKKPELLAPAGSMEALQAAVRCGADAVYVGAQQFSARANAQNFDDKSLKEAATYCHLYGTKIYLAVNTLIFDKEFPALDKLIIAMAEAGIDACIVQDVGVAQYLRNRIPAMPLHASTQLTIHTAEGLELAAEMGFCRVVAAREMSESALKKLCDAGNRFGVEVEVFVHGAHCMSVSGQCFLSAAMGGRSANRGCCAQPCRLPYTADEKRKDAHALSLKDMCLIEYLDAMQEMGVSSLKIEGRMKRPEYVAAAVTAYRNAINGHPYDFETLRAVFSRSGFTDGYFTDHRQKMFGIREKDDVTAAQSVLSVIRNTYQKERRFVQLDALFELHIGQPSKLTVHTANGMQVSAEGAVVQNAEHRPTELSDLKRQFEKLGDTIYCAGSVDADMNDNAMLPSSEMNALRRSACDLMNQSIIAKYTPKYEIISQNLKHPFSDVSFHKPKFRLQILQLRQLSKIKSYVEQLDAIMLPLQLAVPFTKAEQDIPISKCILVPPRYVVDSEKVCSLLNSANQLGFSKLLCNHIGIAKLGRQFDMSLHGGHGLHIANTETAQYWKRYGLADALFSPELPENSMRSVVRVGLPMSLLAYGKLPLMLTRNCPISNQISCKNCRHTLYDRKQASLFTDCTRIVDSPDYCEIFNSEPIWLADRLDSFDFASYFILQMTNENEDDVLEIVKKYVDGIQTDPPKHFTRGLRIQ